VQRIVVVANFDPLLCYFIRINIEDGSSCSLRAYGVNREIAVMVPHLSGVNVLGMNIENV
jgi:hypothetical protein